MDRTYSKLYVHLVWTTRDRHPFLVPNIRNRAYGAIRQQCTSSRVGVIAIGGIEDHVHLLVDLPPAISVSELARRVKGASSHLISHETELGGTFTWQHGFGAFSFHERALPRIRSYIENQEQHHRDHTLIADLEIYESPQQE